MGKPIKDMNELKQINERRRKKREDSCVQELDDGKNGNLKDFNMKRG